MNKSPTFHQFGPHAVLVNWDCLMQPEIHDSVLRFDRYINMHFSDDIIETVFAYQSIVVYLQENIAVRAFILELTEAIGDVPNLSMKRRYLIKVPVCYDLEFAPDLVELAAQHGLSVKAVITRHTQPVYTVSFLGFLPGFPYLEGLDPILHTARKSTPRPFISKGSVAIGAGQTGVYTMDSPGGWNIIGRTPIEFFSVASNPPSLLQADDRVQFVPISKKKYIKLVSDIENKIYIIEKEVFYG